LLFTHSYSKCHKKAAETAAKKALKEAERLLALATQVIRRSFISLVFQITDYVIGVIDKHGYIVDSSCCHFQRAEEAAAALEAATQAAQEVRKITVLICNTAACILNLIFVAIFALVFSIELLKLFHF
jgi:hypothetical protein